MLDILYSLFQTIIHGITTILNMILSIPRYVGYVTSFILTLPSFIVAPLMIALLAAVLIKIKRLVF